MMMTVFILKQNSFVLKGKYHISLFVLLSFLLVIALSVLQLTASDYPLGIFKPLLTNDMLLA